MPNKIVKSFSDKDSGFSVVTIQNKYGHFTGNSVCQDEDMPNFSSLAGQRYAEINAVVKYCEFRYKQEKLKYETILKLQNDIDYLCLSAEEQKASKKIIRKINLKIRDYKQSMEDWKNLAVHLKQSIIKQDKDRQEILLRVKKDK